MSWHLYRLGRWAYRARKTVLALWLVALVAVIAGSMTFGRPSVEGLSIPGTEAQQAMESLEQTFPEMSGGAAQLIVTTPDGAQIGDQSVSEALSATLGELRQVDGVASVSDPFEEGPPFGLTEDGRAALVSIQFHEAAEEIDGRSLTAMTELGEDLREALPDGSQVALGGEAFAGVDVPHDSASELMGLGLALLILLATFGSFVAAGQPLITAVIGVGITLGSIELVTAFTDVSSTAPVLATMLGLAVGIDYALFVLSRHTRQLREGMDPEESAARAVATAGSAVIFAGLTVIIALIALAIVDIPFLTVMGLAAAGAVGLAVLVSLTLTPALLGFSRRFLVRGVERRRARRRAPSAVTARHETTRDDIRPTAADGGSRFFDRWVRRVTARPLVTIGLVVGLVGLLSVPALDLRLGLPDAGTQPSESSARQTYDLVAEHFGPGRNGPLIVTGPIVEAGDPLSLVGELRSEFLAVDGVAAVPIATPDPNGTTALVTVIPESAPDSEATKDLVADLRSLADDLDARYGIALSVTGQTAAALDITALLSDALLPYIGFIVVLSLILLTMVFRSIWVPVKATVGFLLTIGSALGAVSLVYSWGWFTGPLGVEQTGPVVSFMPIIVLGVLFGLAMDYEVFLVSTMREEYTHGAGARAAIARGFARSGPVVTAAALIMFAVFATFIPAADSMIKPIALALAVGVFVDAFLVRMTFVPAVMTLLGDRAWRIPSWLDRWLPALDVEGEKLTARLSRVGGAEVTCQRWESDVSAVRK